MSQVDVDNIFNFAEEYILSLNSYELLFDDKYDFSLESVLSSDSYELLFDDITDTSIYLDNRCYVDSEAYRRTTDIIYDSYNDTAFSAEWDGTVLYDTGINFDFLKVDLRVRSGLCASVSTIQSYSFRAYNTYLNKYVFWDSNNKEFTQDTTGYPPEHLQNISILFIRL